jgi:hypothetical protein
MAAKAALAAARDNLIALCAQRGVRLPPNPNVLVGTALMNTRVPGSNDIDVVRRRSRGRMRTRVQRISGTQRRCGASARERTDTQMLLRVAFPAKQGSRRRSSWRALLTRALSPRLRACLCVLL